VMFGGIRCLWIGLAQILAVNAKSWGREMTVEVPASREDCFYLPNIIHGSNIEVEFQVTDVSSTSGNLDILCRLFSPYPKSDVLYQSKVEKEASFDIDINDEHEEGDYRLCFSNHMSTWSDKTVWFEIKVTEGDDYYDYHDDYIDDEDMEQMKSRNADEASLFEMTVEEIKTSLHKVRTAMGKTRHFQLMYGASMNQDSHQVANNNDKINVWSTIHLTIILLVGFVQVLMIRQLFEDKSFLHKLTSRK